MHSMNTALLAAEASTFDNLISVLSSLLWVAGVLLLPFVAGWLIARAIRMKDYQWKIGLILWTITLATVVIARTWDPAEGRFKIPLGVDLQGGVILIYEVDESIQVVDDVKKQPTDGTQPRADGEYSMSALIEALSRRINPSGTKEIVVRPYGLGQVEIIIPEVDEQAVDQIKKVISTAGVLQFRIVANSRDHQTTIDLARAMSLDPLKKRGRDIHDDSGEAVGRWARVAREQRVKDGVRPFKVAVGDYTVRDAATGALLDIPPDVNNNPADRTDDDRRFRLAKWVSDQGMQEIDVLMATDDGLNVNGSHLGSVMKSKDEFMNPDILFTLKGEGIGLFAELTGRFSPEGNFHRQLGIILDNELLSAPNIQEQITQNGRITGRFTEEEVEFLVNILEAGSLPVVLNKNPISQSMISPLLGRETIRKGQSAMVIATVLVFVFMLVYYRFSGFLACLALVLNILFTLSIMVLINAPLTMPGLAGLVLTVGMSVDANILIFERMREELARGAALRMALRNGFSRATATIIDANLTTILTAVILYWIGTDQLRGFAVTLILGILTSMFTAIFCSRVSFDIVERKRWLTSLKMYQLMGETHWDFLKVRHLAVAASVIVIAIGLVGAIVRGEDLFDIDFTGGSSVQVKLQQPADAEQVRAIIGKHLTERKIPYTLTGMSTAPGQTQNDTFKVDAKIKEVEELEQLIQDAFKSSGGDIKLATYSLTFGPLKTTTVTTQAATTKTELGKTEAGKTEAGKTEASTEPAKSEPAKSEAATEPAKSEPAKSEPAKSEPAKTDAATEPAKSEPSTEPAKPEPAKPEPAKSEPAKSEPAKSEPQPEGGARSDLPPASLLALADPQAGTVPPTTAPPTTAPPTTAAAAGAQDLPAAEAQGTAAAEKKDTAAAAGASGSKPGLGSSGTQSAEVVDVELTFGNSINEPTLRAEIEQTARDLGIPLSYFELNNPAWQPGSSNTFKTWTLRIPASQQETRSLLDRLQTRFQDTPAWSSANKIGPQVAGRMQRTAVLALVASCIGIIIYVWIRFQNLVFGVAAVIALVHDVLVTVAALAVSRWLAGALGFLLVEDFKISLTIVAALLTIIGYSINDTIVIFDRIREIRGKSPDITADMVNLGLNQTLSRTILTSLTVFIVAIVLYGFGGDGIHGFAFSLLVGLISGTYSTIYIASPFVLWLAGKSIQTRSKPIAA